jgi:aryl-alcohol dehydrogenase-like predicted oxidoreductase
VYLEGEERQRKMAARFVNEQALESTRRFQSIAAEAGMSVVTLAIAWSKQHDFVASTIIGATAAAQMPDILAAADIRLEPGILARIDQVSREIRYPMG